MKNYSEHFAKFARQDNILSEKFVRKYPNYMAWKDKQFYYSYGLLLTIIGHG